MTIRRVFLLMPVLSLSLLTAGQTDSRIEVYNLRTWIHSTHTRVVLDIGQLREYTHDKLSSPDRIYVDIYQAKLNPILHGKTIPIETSYLSQIRIGQKSKSSVRVVIDLDFEKIKKYRVWHLFDPFRIVIDIYPVEAVPVQENPPGKIAQPAQPSREGYSLTRQLGLGIRRIVIDPGHGGRDPGCNGNSGTDEKTIVLDVSKRLRDLFSAKNGIEVILTRESDIYMPLESRTVIANQKQADLFISIHANANRNKKLSGVETFYLNFSLDPKVIETAALENATSKKNISDTKEIIKKMVQRNKSVESRELAEQIQKDLVTRLSKNYKNVKNKRAKGGPFWVLIGCEVPSVLVEISYLSNAAEEKRLKNPQYRQQIALGIYEGILNYKQSLGKGK